MRLTTCTLAFVLVTAAPVGDHALARSRNAVANEQARLVGMWRCKLAKKTLALAILPNGRMGLETLSGQYRLRKKGQLEVLQGLRWVTYPYRLKRHRKRKKDRLRIALPNKTKLRCTRLGKGKEHQLRGMLCSWSGSSSSYGGTSYSRSRRVYFDGRGWLTFTSETSFSSRSGLYHNRNKAKLGMYRVVGKIVVVAFHTGGLGVAKVHMRQRSGRITELKHGRTLYATGLCK